MMVDFARNDVASMSLNLRLQHLDQQLQVLALGAVALFWGQADSFTTREIADLQVQARLPKISNPSTVLSRLVGQGEVMRPSSQSWALTPIGEQRLNAVTSNFTIEELADELMTGRGSDFGNQRHAVIPPFLGPARGALGVSKVLADHSFDRNVMLITRYPKNELDHFSDLIGALRETVGLHGMRLHVASDRMAEDSLWGNVVSYMWACKYAIVLLDSSEGVLNSNVLIEVGGMLMTGRRCAILRDSSVPEMPSDLVGHIYKPAELTDVQASIEHIHKWIRDDLKMGACAECPSDRE